MTYDPSELPPPNWKSRKAIIANLSKHLSDCTGELESLRSYAGRTDARNSNQAPPDLPYAQISNDLERRASLSAMRGEDEWAALFAQFASTNLVSQELDFFWHEQFPSMFPDIPPLQMMNWEAAATAMAAAFVVGATTEGSRLGLLTFAALNHDHQLELSYRERHRKAQAFMLRLFADWRGGIAHSWPANVLDEPCYEGILAHWRDPDPEILARHLHDACERHARQAKWDTSTKFYDFGDEVCMRVPLEILLVFRLRQLVGLDSPVIDHELMAPPFARLPAMPVTWNAPPLYDATMRRLRRDWPNFDDVLAPERLAKIAAQG